MAGEAAELNHDAANRHFGKTDASQGNIAGELADPFRRDGHPPRRAAGQAHDLRVGGPADVYVEPASEADLAAVVKFCGARGVPFFVIGRGSNLLVRDGGFRGVVICLSHAELQPD